LASLILNTLKRKVTRFELIPSDGGCFELAVDGRTIYSKLETGEFPDEQAILAQVSS